MGVEARRPATIGTRAFAVSGDELRKHDPKNREPYGAIVERLQRGASDSVTMRRDLAEACLPPPRGRFYRPGMMS